MLKRSRFVTFDSLVFRRECSVRFGPLFEYYNRISNKLVGVLMRARKHGYITFVGEMLYQRRDDDVQISLTEQGLQVASSVNYSL